MRIFGVFAVTPDGKIAPSGVDHYVRLTSPTDIEHLRKLRDKADAVLLGGATWRAFPKVHWGLRRKKPPLHVFLTRTWELPLEPLEKAEAIFFSPNPPPKTLPPGSVYRPLEAKDETGQINEIISYLRQREVRNLMVEGGGWVLRLFIDSGWLQELYLTLAARLLGNETATAFLPGKLENYPQGVELELLSHRREGHELFLHYRIKYPPRTPPEEPATLLT